MVFGSKSTGSKSAQTPSESSQQSRSNTHGAAHAIAGLVAGTNYKVYHMHRKVGHVATRGQPHHSQIFIFNTLNDPPTRKNLVCNIGLFADDDGTILIDDDDPANLDNDNNRYIVSSSYHPNPLTKTGQEIMDAVTDTAQKCGDKYKLLHNNCQKFARMVMQALGATHNRHLFHP